jgi:hypothetical protein
VPTTRPAPTTTVAPVITPEAAAPRVVAQPEADLPKAPEQDLLDNPVVVLIIVIVVVAAGIASATTIGG